MTWLKSIGFDIKECIYTWNTLDHDQTLQSFHQADAFSLEIKNVSVEVHVLELVESRTHIKSLATTYFKIIKRYNQTTSMTCSVVVNKCKRLLWHWLNSSKSLMHKTILTKPWNLKTYEYNDNWCQSVCNSLANRLKPEVPMLFAHIKTNGHGYLCSCISPGRCHS